MHENKPQTPEDLEREVALAIGLASALKQMTRRWSNATEYDLAYRAVTDAIARCAAKVGRDLKQIS